MRIFESIAILAATVSADECKDLCNANLIDCSVAPEKGAYCKTWMDPKVCFAMYYETEDKSGPMYFHTAGDSRSEKFPVTCEDARKMLNTPVNETDYCKELCRLDSNCNTHAARAQGSYNKYWNTPAVCFGYYMNEAGTEFYYYQTQGGDETYPMTNADAKRFVEMRV